jgi:hypothetical protein
VCPAEAVGAGEAKDAFQVMLASITGCVDSARDVVQDAGAGSRHSRTAPRNHQGNGAEPLAEDLIRHARVCQGRKGRLLLPERGEVQVEVRDVRFNDTANLDEGEMWPTSFALKKLNRRGEEDRRTRQKSGELSLQEDAAV